MEALELLNSGYNLQNVSGCIAIIWFDYVGYNFINVLPFQKAYKPLTEVLIDSGDFS